MSVQIRRQAPVRVTVIYEYEDGRKETLDVPITRDVVTDVKARYSDEFAQGYLERAYPGPCSYLFAISFEALPGYHGQMYTVTQEEPERNGGQQQEDAS